MFKALRTIVYHVEDIEQAKIFYTGFLGFGPYFDEPFYVGYDVSGYELGLDPDIKKINRGDTPVTYWQVESIEETFKRLEHMGAKTHSDIRSVGGEIKVASLTDPFGNIIGIIEDPDFR